MAGDTLLLRCHRHHSCWHGTSSRWLIVARKYRVLLQTCRLLSSVTELPQVWHSALLRISHDKRLPHLRLRIDFLPSTALRQKAVLLARLDRLPGGLSQMPFHYMSTRVSLPVVYVWGISFLPGGEWLVVLCRKAGGNEVMICRASDPSGQQSTHCAVPDGRLTMCISTNDVGNLMMVLGSDGPNGYAFLSHCLYCSTLIPPPHTERRLACI